MVEISSTTYKGYEVVKVSNSEISLLVTVSTGPRILSCSAFGSENLFAELPDAELDYPGEGNLKMVGGHRLWYAPEKPETTYIPDNLPVDWVEIEKGIELTQGVDQPTGIRKSMTVQVAESGAKVTVTHKLTNTGEEPFVLAPWAITQLRAGGKAVIPQRRQAADPHGLLPNRNIVLWTYTDLASDLLHLKNEGLYVSARVKEGAIKIGSPNPLGWIGYHLDGLLFVKRADYVQGGDYLDMGASSQVYANSFFIELETLAPVVRLAPGESASHKEVWEVYQQGSWPEDIRGYFD